MKHPRQWKTRDGKSIAAALLDEQSRHIKNGSPATMAELARSVGCSRHYAARVARRLALTGYWEQRKGSALYWVIKSADGLDL